MKRILSLLAAAALLLSGCSPASPPVIVIDRIPFLNHLPFTTAIHFVVDF